LSDSSKDTNLDRFADAKIAAEKLSAIHRRVEALILKWIVPHISRFGSLFQGRTPLEKAEKDIRQFADALIALIRLTKDQERDLMIADVIKNIDRSQSFDEIATLLGLTVLGEYKEQLNRRAQIMRLWKDDISPRIPKVIAIAEFGNELTNLSQRIRNLLNYDVVTKEDDIERMIIAIQGRNFNLFNGICENLQQKVKKEEESKPAVA
jgi:hypothetical protein